MTDYKALAEWYRQVLVAAEPFLQRAIQAIEDVGYGFAAPGNPHYFTPDPELCSDLEMAAHREACRLWDEGKRTDLPGGWGVGTYRTLPEELSDLEAAIDAAKRPLA